MKKEKINLNDRDAGLYLAYQKMGHNNVLNALKVLFLRKDFPSFLDDLENNAFKKDGKFLNLDIEKADTLKDTFIKKIKNSKLMSNLDDKESSKLLQIITYQISLTYYNYLFEKKNNLHKGSSEAITISGSHNFTNVSHYTFDEEIFSDVMWNKLFDLEVEKKYGRPAYAKTIGIEKENSPRILQIVCNDSITKTELQDYIEKNWNVMELYLRNRKKLPNKRVGANKHFIRNVIIYNKYIEFMNSRKKEKYLDMAVVNWLEENKDNNTFLKNEKIPAEGTIRKIIADIDTELRDIN